MQSKKWVGIVIWVIVIFMILSFVVAIIPAIG